MDTEGEVNQTMGKSGEITIFLSMILLCTAGLICVMLESARTAGARCYLQTAANSSIDSLFSQYHRQLWQTYHMLGLEYETEEDIKERCIKFLGTYLEAENWYPMAEDTVSVEMVKSLTDDGGSWLEEEILAYMKFGIWDRLDIAPQEGERFRKDIKEAFSIQKLADSYKTESKEAWKLEQALNRIYECLTKQREHYAKAARELSGEDGSGFFREADLLKKETERIPKLLKAYEKQADKLISRLDVMDTEFSKKREDLTDERAQAMEQELVQYRSYIAEDGERRQELLALIPEGERNLPVIEEVKNRVDEIESYLSSLDEEDDDNSGPMWDSAESHWNQIKISGMAAAGVKDEEKRGWLSQVENMVNLNLLELVTPPEREISTILLKLEDAPSGGQKKSGETDGGNLVNRVLVNEYCAMHFSDFISVTDPVSETAQGVLKPQYEMEYLLAGKENDRDNLAETVKTLLAVREGMNLVHILSDSEKREEARGLALVITGALGVTPLVEITAFFVMSIWALGESIMDIKALLAGGKIPLLKRRTEWTLGLDQLLTMGREERSPASAGNGEGIDYDGYLKLLLLLEPSGQKYYRMMDVMQMNLRLEQAGFLMRQCGYRVDIKAQIRGKHVFFALPFVENLTGSREHGYQMQVRTQKAY